MLYEHNTQYIFVPFHQNAIISISNMIEIFSDEFIQSQNIELTQIRVYIDEMNQ